jgi:DNA-directed RNA polymerase specialized sigma24 family protein
MSRPSRTPAPPPQAEADPPPFDVLYREWHAFVRSALGRMGVAARDVDDAAQDVFCVVLRDLPAYEERGRLVGWLATIVANVAAEHRRREGRLCLARTRPRAGCASPAARSTARRGAFARATAVRPGARS